MASVKLLDPADAQRRLDRYELIGEIASGGMATVYLARLGGVGGFQRFVAIKRLHPHLASDPEFVDMFLDEARLAAGIHHPHVVPILEVGISPAGYYLVMEYVEGDTLARVIARALSAGGKVPRPILLRAVLDALAGLHAAHELTDPQGRLVGLVHRDVSPQNLLVGTDGSTRITDFGVARATERLSSTRAGKLKGKLAYMAPEQTDGGAIDRRADVFAMGIILWEVLASQRLFKAENEAATLALLLQKPIQPVSAVALDVPAAFDEVCQKALERAPERRYQTAAEMADALERAARRASAASPLDAAIATSREVATFVQAILGREILAQRECVRAWLAQSEPSGLTEPSINSQITIRVPLKAPNGAAAALADLDAEALGDTLVGDGAPASEPAPEAPASAAASPSEAAPHRTPRAWPPRVAGPPPPPPVPNAPPAEVGPGRSQRTLRGLPQPPSPPAMTTPSTAEPSFGPSASVEIDPDLLDTRQMQVSRAPIRTLATPERPSGLTPAHAPLGAPSPQPPPVFYGHDDVDLSFAVQESPGKKRWPLLAVGAGALAGGYLTWLALGPMIAAAKLGGAPEATPAAPVPAAIEAAAARAPEPAPSPAAIEPAAPSATASAPNADTAAPSPATEPAPTQEPPAPRDAEGARPSKKRGSGTSSSKPDKPASTAAPGDNLANPYR
jgi:serine/threonine-protein kinase